PSFNLAPAAPGFGWGGGFPTTANVAPYPHIGQPAASTPTFLPPSTGFINPPAFTSQPPAASMPVSRPALTSFIPLPTGITAPLPSSQSLTIPVTAASVPSVTSTVPVSPAMTP